MASINSVSSSPTPYTPVTRPASPAKPAVAAPTTTAVDRDHDGDTDGQGLDVHG